MWFIFALLSLIFAGLQSFFQKVGAERRYDTFLLSAVSALFSSVCAFILMLFIVTPEQVEPLFYIYAIVSGVLFLGFTVTRLESLHFIDSAIFFPLYKVGGPALVAAFGILWFHDKVSPLELAGIVLSCLIPLLLITRQENHRQRNLRLGLLFMLVSTVLSAIAIAINTLAVKSGPDLSLPLVAIANGFAALVGILLFARRHKQAGFITSLRDHVTRPMLLLGFVIGIMQLLSFYLLLLAIAANDLSIVYSINAHYILIPVVLSVWLYKEHWNVQKAIALVLSILALILLHP